MSVEIKGGYVDLPWVVARALASSQWILHKLKVCFHGTIFFFFFCLEH